MHVTPSQVLSQLQLLPCDVDRQTAVHIAGRSIAAHASDHVSRFDATGFTNLQEVECSSLLLLAHRTEVHRQQQA
jgi:hypothetical protein